MKYLLLIILSFFTMAGFANQDYQKEIETVSLQQYYNAPDNTIYIRVINTTYYRLQCTIYDYNSRYVYYNFTVEQHTDSNWYVEPAGYYEWRCK